MATTQATKGVAADNAVIPSKYAALVTLAGSGTIPLDAALSTKFRTTLTASSTMAAFSNPYDGATVILWVRQGGSGSYTLALNANVRYTAAVPSITLSTAVGKTDKIGLLYDAIDSKWDVVAFAAAV